MLKHKLKVLLAVTLIISILVPTYVSFVSSSSGFIRVNATSTSVPNQQVAAGGNVSLYFGDVSWDEAQLFLFLSQDSYSQMSYGDFVYSPEFSVSNLTDTTASSVYSNGNGVWFVGNNWINGSIPPTVSVGSYTIKAVDDVGKAVAVTDVFISVYEVISASLEVSPSSGPGGVPVHFTGSGYDPSDNVTVSYYDPTFNSWNYFTTATADQYGTISFDSEIPDLRTSLRIGDYPETTTMLSFRSQVNAIVYGYADYLQYSRGIKRVGL